MASVGQGVPRLDGMDKATGRARYVDDLRFPGMLHATTIRSTIARGRVTSIRFDFDTTGFIIVDHRDIPGRNVVASIEADQPCLVEREVRHAAEPILLVAHPDRERLLSAAVRIEYEDEPATLDPALATRSFKDVLVEKGRLAAGFARAALVVEGKYHAGHQEHAYIETNGVVAVPGRGGVTVYGSLQCPYYVHRALCELLALPPGRVRVVQAETGGGFGGKEEYPSMIAGHAALLALKAKRPVKLVYDRAEDMSATTKRHPASVRHRTGVTRDGRLTAMEIDVVLDGGAYCTLSPVVLSRGVLHATGPYRCPHVRVSGRVVMTNTPPNGAFRGFGAPQTQLAAEIHMDRIAEALGLDPVRVRRLNALRPGDRTATGQRMDPSCSAVRVLDEAVRRTRFLERRRELAGSDRGIGLSLCFHGAGFTGSGEVMLASRASLELTRRGVRILTASAEIGQGARTVHAQIVADALGWPLEAVEVARADTARVPNSGPTVASRTSMVVGRILQRAAREMKRRLGDLSPAEYLRRHGPLVVTKQYRPPPGVRWDDTKYRGAAYAAYGWGCDVVEVALDRDTFEIRPIKVTAVVDAGRILHPVLAEGQVAGGIAQGVGYALTEQVTLRDGRMANAEMANYLVPTTLDTPPIEVVFIENLYAAGPFGAKGMGELPFDGAAPAVVNAIRHLGVDVRSVPATPERIMEAMEARCDSR